MILINDIISELRWQDIADIAIVTFVFYRLFLLIKGTRAFYMLMGLVVLFVTFVISRWLGLYTLDWLIQSFGSYIVLALIILFQPEIRKALVQMGQNPLTQRLTPMEESKYIEEIIRASVSMASKKIGAIIVIERNTELKDLIEMGTRLDARITKELLTSIFLPYSPIHDGAVIIKADRVVAAGCFLPLTISADVSKALGTRHRAAIGVTEETDAVVIVVSEETGDISVSIDGNIMRRLDTPALRRVLTNIFQQDKRREKSTWYGRIGERITAKGGSKRVRRIINEEELNK